MIGQSFSQYKILDKLGEGGMGIVYKAHDLTLDRIVALKFLPSYLTTDSTEKERFYHEARAASSLNHPNISTIYEIKEFEGKLYIAMEYVEGKTAKKLIEQESLTIKRVLDLAIQICDGLASAHEKGVVHRDIKSDNIMITPKSQVKIMDFGLAKVKGATKLTKAGSTIGTAAYMSPEQAQGEEVDLRSDIFSFGVVLYELLTGKLPFRGEHQAALMYSLINEPPQPIARFNEKVTPEIERIVGKALEKDREDRYQHIDDAMSDLRRERKHLEYARTGYTTTTMPVSPVPVTQARSEIVPPSQQPPDAGRSLITSRSGIAKYLIGAAAIVMLIILVVIFNPFNFQITTQQSSAAAEEKNSLAVLYFQNIADPEDKDHTGDMLADLLITALSQTRDLDVISRERLFDIQKEMQTELKAISPELASKVAQRAGVSTMLLGSILQKSPDLAITTRLVDVKSGKIISSQRVTGFTTKQIFSLVDTLALLVRNDLRVTPAGQAEMKSVAEVTTKSPEAYRSYIEAENLNAKFFYVEAAAAYRRAIELDSNFAMAYFGMGTASGNAIGTAERRAAIRRAWELRNEVTERERLAIEAIYEGEISSNPAKSTEIMENLLKKYPREQSIYVRLASTYAQMGEHDAGLRMTNRGLAQDSLDKELWNLHAYLSVRLNKKSEAFDAIDRYAQLAPAEPNPYDSKGDLYMIVGQHDSALYWWTRAISFKSDFPSAEKIALYKMLVRDFASAEKYILQSSSSRGEYQSTYIEEMKLLLALCEGRAGFVRDRMMDVLASRQGDKQQDLRLGALQALAWLSYELGDYASMLRYQEARSNELKLDRADRFYGRDELAMAYAKTGNMRRASSLIEEMEREIVNNILIQKLRVQFTKAWIQLEAGNAPEALKLFESVYDQLRTNHAPQYFYGVALLKNGKLDEAIREFSTSAKYSPIYLSWYDLDFLPATYYWPNSSVKSHYWLGVAYETQGKNSLAMKSFETFLNFWKKADFNSPEIADARSRLAKLKGTL